MRTRLLFRTSRSDFQPPYLDQDCIFIFRNREISTAHNGAYKLTQVFKSVIINSTYLKVLVTFMPEALLANLCRASHSLGCSSAELTRSMPSLAPSCLTASSVPPIGTWMVSIPNRFAAFRLIPISSRKIAS